MAALDGVEHYEVGQLDLDLGDSGRVAGIGNKPLLMVFKFFALATTEQSLVTRAPWDGVSVELRCEPNPKYGLATQFDKHFFMFVISKMAHIKRTCGSTPRKVDVTIGEYLRATNTTSTGYAYDQVRLSIQRLQSMRIYTNIEMNGRGVDEWFSWFQRASMHYETRNVGGKERRCMTSFTIEPCDWIVAALEEDAELLTYAPEYFQLKSAFVQRVYEVARVESEQEIFKISLERLMLQTGFGHDAKAFRKNFRRQVVNSSGTGQTNVPEHAVYAFTAAAPETSVDWSQRVKAEDQWYVFVRNAPQQAVLEKHLDDIPEWEPSLSDYEMRTITPSAEKLKEAVMTS
ncbi:replication initiator protein A [Salipiger mucosus]|uniref:replication initiator protein A n=1 Tax=Salipiger mucosus TaxID=263378 RepID=UPI0018DE4200|nr:replication initiator protein A [Salipiger mucosus]